MSRLRRCALTMLGSVGFARSASPRATRSIAKSHDPDNEPGSLKRCAPNRPPRSWTTSVRHDEHTPTSSLHRLPTPLRRVADARAIQAHGQGRQPPRMGASGGRPLSLGPSCSAYAAVREPRSRRKLPNLVNYSRCARTIRQMGTVCLHTTLDPSLNLHYRATTQWSDALLAAPSEQVLAADRRRPGLST
jgi:hypothetical protein